MNQDNKGFFHSIELLSKLKDDERGIVVNNKNIVVNVDRFGQSIIAISEDGGIDTDAIRNAMLFWDRLVFPCHAKYGPRHNEDDAYLMREGVMERALIKSHSDPATAFKNAQATTFDYLSNQSPGQWAFGAGDLTFCDLTDQLELHRGVTITLQGAIPFPSHDTPFAEILEFRHKRRSELLSMRNEIDSIGATLDVEENDEAALSNAIKRVETACADVLKVAKESKNPFRLGTVELDVNKFIVNAHHGYKMAIEMGASVHASILTGSLFAASSCLKINYKGPGWRGHEASSHPFRYVAYAHQEL